MAAHTDLISPASASSLVALLIYNSKRVFGNITTPRDLTAEWLKAAQPCANRNNVTVTFTHSPSAAVDMCEWIWEPSCEPLKSEDMSSSWDPQDPSLECPRPEPSGHNKLLKRPPSCFEDAPSRRWDARFCAREMKADRFFKAGKVFAMLWDATGHVDAFLSSVDSGETPIVESTSERSLASIRRFVVVRAHQHFVQACAIVTYGNHRRHGTHKYATAYNTGTKTGSDDVDEALEEHRNGRRLLKYGTRTPSIAVSNGHSGATSPLGDVGEHIRPQTGQMFAYARDTALLIGQVCVSIPIGLYGTAATEPDLSLQDRSNFRNCSCSLRFGATLIRNFLAPKLSTSLLEPMIDPSPAVFVTACLVFGALVTTHHHYNRDSITQKPLLVAGTVAGVAASAFCCQNGGFIQSTAVTVPVLVIVCLLLGHLVDTITQCVLGEKPGTKEKHTLLCDLQGLAKK